MHPSARSNSLPCLWLTCLENFGRGGDIDGELQGRIGLRAGAGRQDVPGGREGQVPARDALRLALLLGAPEHERVGGSTLLVAPSSAHRRLDRRTWT